MSDFLSGNILGDFRVTGLTKLRELIATGKVEAPEFIENNVSLVDKYLGINSTADNADKLDGITSGSFLRSDTADNVSGVLTYSAIPAFNGGATGSSAPFTVDSTFLVSNLNAELLNGQTADKYARTDIAETFTKKVTFNEDVDIIGTLNVLTPGEITYLNSTTVRIDDKNIELGTVDTPTDVTADGGGITLKGASDKTIKWTKLTDTWDFNKGVIIEESDGTDPYLLKLHNTSNASKVGIEFSDHTTQSQRGLITFGHSDSYSPNNVYGTTFMFEGKETADDSSINIAVGVPSDGMFFVGNSKVALEGHEHNIIKEKGTVTFGVEGLTWSDVSGNGGDGLDGNELENPKSDWYHHITTSHNNSSGYYTDLSMGFHSDDIYFRRVASGTAHDFVRLWHSGDFDISNYQLSENDEFVKSLSYSGGVLTAARNKGTDLTVNLSALLDDTDTKNTTGSTDNGTNKIFLVGATSQATNPVTYSDSEVYVKEGILTTDAVEVGGGSARIEYNETTKSMDFIFS